MEPRNGCQESLGSTDVEEVPNLEEGRKGPHVAFTNANEAPSEGRDGNVGGLGTCDEEEGKNKKIKKGK